MYLSFLSQVYSETKFRCNLTHISILHQQLTSVHFLSTQLSILQPFNKLFTTISYLIPQHLPIYYRYVENLVLSYELKKLQPSRRKTKQFASYFHFPTSHTTVRVVQHTAVPILGTIEIAIHQTHISSLTNLLLNIAEINKINSSLLHANSQGQYLSTYMLGNREHHINSNWPLWHQIPSMTFIYTYASSPQPFIYFYAKTFYSCKVVYSKINQPRI